MYLFNCKLYAVPIFSKRDVQGFLSDYIKHIYVHKNIGVDRFSGFNFTLDV